MPKLRPKAPADGGIRKIQRQSQKRLPLPRQNGKTACSDQRRLKTKQLAIY